MELLSKVWNKIDLYITKLIIGGIRIKLGWKMFKKLRIGGDDYSVLETSIRVIQTIKQNKLSFFINKINETLPTLIHSALKIVFMFRIQLKLLS